MSLSPPSSEDVDVVSRVRLMLQEAKSRRDAEIWDTDCPATTESDRFIRTSLGYHKFYAANHHLHHRLCKPLFPVVDRKHHRKSTKPTPGTSTQRSSSSSSSSRIGDTRTKDPHILNNNINNKSLFSSQPGIITPHQNAIQPTSVTPTRHLPSAEWHHRETDGLIGLAGVGMGARRKSLADMLQEGLGTPALKPGHLSRPSSCNAFDAVLDPIAVSDPKQAELHNRKESLNGLRSGAAGMVRVKSLGSSLSQSFASAVAPSLSRRTTPEVPLGGMSTACNLPPLGGRVAVPDKNVFSHLSSGMNDDVDILDSFSGLSLSKSRAVDENNHAQSHMDPEFINQTKFLFDKPNGHTQPPQQHPIDNFRAKMPMVPTRYEELAKTSKTNTDLKTSIGGQVNLLKSLSSANLFTKAPSAGSLNLEKSGSHCLNVEMENINLSGYHPGDFSVHQRLNPSMTNHLGADATMIGNTEQSFRSANHLGSGFQVPVVDPLYVQYLQRTSDLASLGGNFLGAEHADLLGIENTYITASQERQQYNIPFSYESDGFNYGYYGSPAFGFGMPYTRNPMASPVRSGIHIFPNKRFSCVPSIGGSTGSWSITNGGTFEESFPRSLLEEFKNSKTRCFELSEIVGHVVEFSADQYGSRFIQQKLETATVDEKDMIFPEITSHAHTLMTDVFGNYVIQKFFEHGTESQRKELASQLTGHVLPLSLQMYGCRVIQKALEVVDVDQQTEMVAELGGSIMKCVRDQNGNHVIQKCIECVPQDRIQFIVSSFYGQVLVLSTHPYGCRVIQRVLEYCHDADTQCIIMEEILHSVCNLAQDQYGNYVVQHVLQHGKPHERSTIISQLAGQIVKMSQQKFASNVIEKCLTFGGVEERQLLVNEMLGSTDENGPLQAMMKDPYGNYVVQKVLETCDNQSRDLILACIRVHLNALKKYTYGKHVTRVEKLITTGERRRLHFPREGALLPQ